MLKTIVIYIIFLIFAVAIQSNLFTNKILNNSTPDLFVILTVLSALKFNNEKSIIMSFLIGIIADFSTGLIIGPQAAGHLAACLFTISFSKNVYSNRLFSLAIIISAAVFVKEIVSNLVANFFFPNDIFSDRFSFVLSTLPYEIFFTALIAPFFLRILSRKVISNN